MYGVGANTIFLCTVYNTHILRCSVRIISSETKRNAQTRKVRRRLRLNHMLGVHYAELQRAQN